MAKIYSSISEQHLISIEGSVREKFRSFVNEGSRHKQTAQLVKIIRLCKRVDELEFKSKHTFDDDKLDKVKADLLRITPEYERIVNSLDMDMRYAIFKFNGFIDRYGLKRLRMLLGFAQGLHDEGEINYYEYRI